MKKFVASAVSFCQCPMALRDIGFICQEILPGGTLSSGLKYMENTLII